MQSTIEEFDRNEGPRVIAHVNGGIYPLINIWLKTYGLKSFVVQCRQWEVDKRIKDLNLIRKERTHDMKTKNAFSWNRGFSAIPGAITIPTGAPVEKRDGDYFIVPSFFRGAIERHDATYYGCRVKPENVEN